jgi:hypothetical protein
MSAIVRRSLYAVVLLAAAHLAPFSVAIFTAQAATQNAAPTSTAKPPVIRAPLAPPPVNDVTRAYDFRTRLSGNPECQRFASESDAVFLNGSLSDEQKETKLKALGAEAKAAGCVN